MANKPTQKEIDAEISNNNKQSFDSVYKSDLGLRKFWLTSGRPNVRERHNYYQSLGLVPTDYEYAPGLKFPGDPDCKDPKELDGCSCTIVFNE